MRLETISKNFLRWLCCSPWPSNPIPILSDVCKSSIYEKSVSQSVKSVSFIFMGARGWEFPFYILSYSSILVWNSLILPNRKDPWNVWSQNPIPNNHRWVWRAAKEFGWMDDAAFFISDSLRFAGILRAWLVGPAPLSCTGWRYLLALSPQDMSPGLAHDVFKKLLKWPSGFQAGGAFYLMPAILPSLWSLLLCSPRLGPSSSLYLPRYSVAVDWPLWPQICTSVLLHTFQPCPLLPVHTCWDTSLCRTAKSLISNLVFSSNITFPSIALTLIASTNCGCFNNLKVMRPSVLQMRGIVQWGL